jgi:hypothetical protein
MKKDTSAFYIIYPSPISVQGLGKMFIKAFGWVVSQDKSK